MLYWRLTFAHLTGQAVAATIRAGRPGVVGPILTRLVGHTRSPATGVAVLTNKQAAALRAGPAYVNLGTSRNPNGEIRGRIRRVS
jgi:hypothetical protein